MSTEYTYSDPRQNLASLLEKAARGGEVKIKRKDGLIFVIKPEQMVKSPIDVDGIDLGTNTEEIVEYTRESRRRLDK